MSICPLCNGLEDICYNCPDCNGETVDQGRLTDYLDDYSAYLPIELTKMVDGDSESLKEDHCVHTFYCPDCHMIKNVMILE